MFNSYDKKKFVVGNEYYTYYTNITNRGNALKDYTGIMKVKVLSNDPTEHAPEGYTVFEILESKKLSATIAHNIHLYMDGHGSASTMFYNTKEECIVAHDNKLKKIAENQTTSDKERILKKLIVKIPEPETPKEILWYNSLSEKEKNMVKWIKHYWDGI